MSATSLQGRVAVVTGAGRGIGRAIAVGLAGAGAKVVCSARSLEEIEETALIIRDCGGEAVAVQADVTDALAVSRVFGETVRQFGAVHVVFANAGVAPVHATVADSDPTAWREAFDTNVFGVYLTARTAAPWLKLQGGKFILIGSGMRRAVASGRSAYAASKAAAWMLVQTLAIELQSDGISVNELIPGPVRTEMTAFGTGKLPQGEWIKEPEDVIPMALFLASHPEPGPTAQSFSLMRRA